MVSSKDLFEKAVQLTHYVSEVERDNIYKAAKIMGDCMNNNGVVQLFGLEYGLEFAMELGYRAGGLMPFHKADYRDLCLRGYISEEELHAPEFYHTKENAKKLLDIYRIEKEDMYIFVSETGCEAMIVEAAKIAKAEGRDVIAVVSKKASEAATSTHPSGDKLTDVADLVLDTHTEASDAVQDVDGTHKMNHLFSLSGNIIAQMLTGEIYRYLTENGFECPVLLSANLKGADVHNRRLSDKYLGRWNS